MNLLQQKSNQFLRDAILEENIDKARRYLTLKLGKADVSAITESGGFSMLHCASLMGNTQIVLMLLQLGADLMALTDDGYSALDLAIWKGHLQVIELLRSQGCVAPIKEPESLNGYVILHLGHRATVVDYQPIVSMQNRSLRALYYEDTRQCLLVNLWSGIDYRIIGLNPHYEELRKLDFTYAEAIHAITPQDLQKKQVEQQEEEIYDALLQGQAFFDDDSDSQEENEIKDVIEIRVPPGPLGVLLNSGIQDCAVIHGFVDIPGGGRGPIETHGSVYPGMYIIGINEVNASLMSLQQVTRLLGKLGRKEKVIRFATFRPVNSKAAAAETPETLPSHPSTSPLPIASNQDGFDHHRTDIQAEVTDKNEAGCETKVASVSQNENECAYCGVPASAHTSELCPYK